MKRLFPSIGHLTLNLRSLSVLLVILALVLALMVQQQRAALRVRALRAALAKAHAMRAADERMRGLLGDRGIFLLNTAARVETLSVGRGAGYPRSPTGVDLDKATAAQLRLALLDPNNYVYLDADDMPVPQAGFRFRDGDASLDILVSLEGSNSNSPHQDIFIIINKECDNSEHRGSMCMYSRSLQDLIVATRRPGG